MKSLLKVSLVLSVFSLFFVSCAKEEQKPEDFKTLEEAQTALSETQEELFSALYALDSVANVAATFDGTYPSDFGFKNRRSEALSKRHSPHSFGYSPSTGFWTFDTTFSDIGFTSSFVGRIRFTPRDPITGLPNESTNTMECDATASFSGAGDGGHIGLNYDADLNLTGIAGFRASTGNATITGTDNVDFNIDGTFDTDHIVLDYEHNYKINNVVVSPFSDYPQSGSFEFTIRANVSPAQYGESFYVGGTITFDGSNIAVLEFGGFTFEINMDTETITPV